MRGEKQKMSEKKSKITVAEAGRRGGLRTSETHDEEFYSEIGRKGGKIGGSKGGQRVRKLIQAGKEHEEDPERKQKTEEKSKSMTVAEAGRKGGEKTAMTHGREFYEEIGRRGGEKVMRERGPEFFSEIGSKGGSERAKQHEGAPEARGKTSLEEAGHRGGQRVRKLIQAGKEHEDE